MDKILLIFGLAVAVALVTTGGFGIADFGVFEGFRFGGFGSGPKATGPDGGNLFDPENFEPASQNNNEGASTPETRVEISSVSVNNEASAEYVVLENRGNIPINISSWSIGNTQGKRYPLGGAAKIPFITSASQVTLAPGEVAYVHTGTSPLGYGFQENSCMGYFLRSYDFNPSISAGCYRVPTPSPAQYNDRCLRFIQQHSSSCQVPTYTSDDIALGYGCEEYVSQNFTYPACVNQNKTKSDFYKRTWHLYLNRPSGLWRDFSDVITLYDEAGIITDTYQY